MTLFSLLERYLQKNLRIQKKTTIDLYRSVIRRVEDYLGRDAVVDDLNDDTVAGFVRSRLDAGLSPHTVSNETAKLKALWHFAAKNNQAPWPTLVVPRPRPPIPKAWTRKELGALWRAASRCKRPLAGVDGKVYWLAMLGVLYDTAERIGPVYRIKRHDIDLDGRTVWMRQRKGNAPDVQKVITKRTTKSLARLTEIVEGDPFRICDRTSLYYHYNYLLADAGLPATSRDKFHKIRRTHATYIHEAAGDATASLGHSCDSITRAHYIDPQIAKPKIILPNPFGFWRRLFG